MCKLPIRRLCVYYLWNGRAIALFCHACLDDTTQYEAGHHINDITHVPSAQSRRSHLVSGPEHYSRSSFSLAFLWGKRTEAFVVSGAVLCCFHHEVLLF